MIRIVTVYENHFKETEECIVFVLEKIHFPNDEYFSSTEEKQKEMIDQFAPVIERFIKQKMFW
jgi:hypothetical protein